VRVASKKNCRNVIIGHIWGGDIFTVCCKYTFIMTFMLSEKINMILNCLVRSVLLLFISRTLSFKVYTD